MAEPNPRLEEIEGRRMLESQLRISKTAPRPNEGGRMNPTRIQRKRTKGWRMPENTVYVGRGSKWGNPFAVGSDFIISERFSYGTSQLTLLGLHAGDAVTLYGLWLMNHNRADVLHPHGGMARAELAGKNLACWCPLDQPCHADVLLKVANS